MGDREGRGMGDRKGRPYAGLGWSALLNGSRSETH